MTQFWDPQRYGCIQRDSFRLRPVPRTAMTTMNGVPRLSKTGDVRAPIEANFSITQSFAQWTSFTQWHLYDLAGGALPFRIDLWLWGKRQRVRARMMGSWQARRLAFDTYELSGTFEIERESVT